MLGIWYQPGGDGGRGLLPASAPTILIKPDAGVAGKVREKACEMRVVRARRKESVGDMVVVSSKRQSCRLMQVQESRREREEKFGTNSHTKSWQRNLGVDEE